MDVDPRPRRRILTLYDVAMAIQKPQTMKLARFGAAAVLVVAAIAALRWLGPSHAPDPQDTAAPTPRGAQTHNASPFSALSPDPSSPPATNPPEVRRGFEVDSGGHLRVTRETRRLFDDVLAEQGALDNPASVERAKAAVHRQLKEPAASEATALLERYVALLKAQSELQGAAAPTPQAGNANLSAILQTQQISALRKLTLGPQVSQAFYGDEDAYQRYLLARQQVMQMNGLSDAQKEEQLSALRKQLPASVLEAVNAP